MSTNSKYHPLDNVGRRINFYPDLLKQANDNGFESLHDYIWAIYEQWESIAVVGKYIGKTSKGTRKLMRRLKIPVKLSFGGYNNVRLGILYLGTQCRKGHGSNGSCPRYINSGICFYCLQETNKIARLKRKKKTI